MSHFSTIVLISKQELDVEAEVGALLVPFDENIEVEEYECDCHCVGAVARDAAHKAVEEKFGPIDEVRKTYHALPKEEQTDEKWEGMISGRKELYAEIVKNHSMRDKPDPGCNYEDGSGCGATGKYMSTYNPNSKWDWWCIGGRWTGVIDPGGYEPENDPDNIEACMICGGTGDRPGWVHYDKEGKRQFKDDWAEKCNGCNSCHGEGKHTKWPTSWKSFAGDIQPVSKMKRDRIFAIVTPDGQWHEKGDMGWWGMVKDEKPTEDWDLQVSKILHKYQDHVAVVCDLHI